MPPISERGVANRPAVVRLEGHHRQCVDRQAGEQVVHGNVADHRDALDPLADALRQLERIDCLVDRCQRQSLQPLGVHRAVPGSRKARDDIRAKNRLLVETGSTGAYLAVVQHGQESRDRGGAQVDRQTERRLAAPVAVAAAEVFVGIDDNGRKDDACVALDSCPAGEAIVQRQLARCEVLELDLVRRSGAFFNQYLALAAGAPSGAGLLQWQAGCRDGVAEHAVRRDFDCFGVFTVDDCKDRHLGNPTLADELALAELAAGWDDDEIFASLV